MQRSWLRFAVERLFVYMVSIYTLYLLEVLNSLRTTWFEKNFSFLNRWSVYKDHLGFRGYTLSLHHGVWGHWYHCLPLEEFAKNNNIHFRIQMVPFEVLYGKRFMSPVGWFESFEVKPCGIELLRDLIDHLRMIQ